MATATAPGGIKDDVQEGERRRSLRPILWGVAVVVVAAILFWGIRYYSYAHVHQTTDDAHVDANVVQVSTKVSERVDRILVDADQPVHKGQLLVVLDNTTEQAALNQAEANLQLARENQQTQSVQGAGGVTTAQAQVQNAASQIPQAQAGVAVAQAQLRAAQAALPGSQEALAKAQADLSRTRALVASGDIARSQLDASNAEYAQAQSQYRAAQANVTAAIANLQLAQQRVGQAESGVAAAQGGVQTAQGKLSQAQASGTVAAAQAAVAIAQQNLANTKIFSPITGHVGERNVEAGQTLNPGATVLTLIPQNVFITAYYKETQIGKMHAGEPVDIRLDAYKGMTFHGHVLSINPASQNTYAIVPSQNATGNFVKVTQRIPVKISVDDADPQKYPLRPGMSVVTSVRVQ